MLNLKCAVLSALLILVTPYCFAAAKVTAIQIDGPILLFTMDESKSDTTPDCVEQGNEELWGFDLTQPQGRAAYILLLSAVSSQLPVEVITTGACLPGMAVEQALSLYFTGESQP
ncbi:hypothetical protein P2G88_01135 [Aliiglaciecola sp. CAU 1673]|uniref:hypothetical protein n=1 Tax=Aliiglaciecola sp. CAU 1673 TaxID=3032595 RepID=UPI0023DB0D02|nr:hypothetical protein [Aliiglaciecola sp. CAU 1673]MDF2176854.1 hypothetical protein [Aliiglaciecola sp. CAU 1673]